MSKKRIFKKLTTDEIVERLHGLQSQLVKELADQEEAMLKRHERITREIDLLGNQINRIIDEQEKN